jgi:hypothetical protein
LLLVVHASTYNKTLRKVHSRQQQMSGAMELLRSLPSFSGFSYATIATLAFELSRVRRADGAVIQVNSPLCSLLVAFCSISGYHCCPGFYLAFDLF